MTAATTKAVNSPHGPADPATQRLNMVESQVRPSDVTDRRIIRAMGEIPREAFVPAHLKSVAYMDDVVPLGRDRQMLAPRTLAKMIQELQIDEKSVVLAVGAGTGYAAAVLARLARKVVALEIDPSLAETAKARLTALDIAPETVRTGPLADGRANEGPYDAILVEGAIAVAPATLLDQLKEGGRLVAIRQIGPAGKVVVWTRTGRLGDPREVFDASALGLPGFERAVSFSL